MTSAIQFPTYVIGLMSGTSADGVDAALLFTDGQSVAVAHESVFVPYDDALRAQIIGLMRGEGNEAAVSAKLTDVHIVAVEKLLGLTKIARAEVKLIGFHGQTIRHAPHEGVTQQIGDGARLARETGIPVVADFRSNDVKHGGQGAPLVPLYHAALVADQAKPVMVVNIGGVANVTWIGECVGEAEPLAAGVSEAKGGKPSSSNTIVAFDCGPGNALLDDWVLEHTGERYDKNGALAAQGEVDEEVVEQFLATPFFAQPVPKSLDRNAFDVFLDASAADGAATLTAMTAAAIAKACEAVPQKPQRLLIAGGGRHNPTLMQLIEKYSGCKVEAVEHLGWNGDMLEAEAFAYLAARSVQGLPLSLPSTTGVKEPVTGGKLFSVEASHHHHHDDDDGDNTAPRSCCR